MSGHEKTRAAVLAAIMVISVFGATVAFSGAAAAEDISQCREINQPGTYTLTEDIDDDDGNTCIEIESSNVVFDGNGNEITDVSNTLDNNNDNTSAIQVEAQDGDELDNVTVRDVFVQNYDNGVRYSNVEGGEITGVTAERNSEGIDVEQSDEIVVDDNTLENNMVVEDGGAGVTFSNTDDSEVTNNEFTGNNIGVFASDGSDDNTISGNNVTESNEDGISLFGGTGNTIEENMVTTSTNNGIILAGDDVSNTDVLDNNVTNNDDDGVNLNDADGSLIQDNEIRNNGDTEVDNRNGITFVNDVDGTNVTDNVIAGNDQYGIFIEDDDDDDGDTNYIYDNILNQEDNDDNSNEGSVDDNILITDDNDDDGDDYRFFVEPTNETNVIGGNQTGGNFYAQPDGTGFSQNCQNEDDNPNFCDGPADIDGDGDFSDDEGSDQFPLTNNTADRLDIEPKDTDFGEVEVGQSENRTVSFTNEGDDPISLDLEDNITEDNPDYRIVDGDTSSQTLNASESTTVTVEFNPNSLGNSSVDLIVTDTNASDNSDMEANFTGEGVNEAGDGGGDGQGEIEVAESAMFGDVEVGNSEDRTVTVLNDGDGPVEVTDTSIGGPDGDEFTVVDNPAGNQFDDESFTLEAGEERNLTVRFSPDSPGDKTATLVTGTEDDGTERTALSGTGVEADDGGDGGDGAENVITIEGTGPRTDYKLSVTNSLEKSTANGANINQNDQINRGYAANGEVGTGSDSYTYNGTLETIKVNSDNANVIVNGEELSDEEIDSMPNRAIEFQGTGPRANYDFSANGDEGVQKITANSANINNNDGVYRTTGYGVTGAYRDAFGFSGRLRTIDAPDSVEVYVQGKLANQDAFRDQSITLVGSGERATYEFTADSDLLKSTVNFANLNSNDEVDGTTATGVVGTASDSFVYNDDISEFTADGDLTVFIDGQQEGQNEIGS